MIGKRSARGGRPRRSVQRSRGFTMFELVATVCMIAILASVGNNRLRYYQELAEKSVMEMTLGAMTAGLRYRVAQILITSSVRTAGDLVRVNPVTFLQDPPKTYLGEFAAPNVKVEPGAWYYDLARHEVVYVPVYTDNLVIKDGSPGRLRFRIKLSYDRLPDANVSNDQPMLVGAKIEPAVNFAWF